MKFHDYKPTNNTKPSNNINLTCDNDDYEYDNYEKMDEKDEYLKYETNATKVEIEIKGMKIYAILDSGAGKNVISERLRQKLQIKGMRPSKKRFTIADGKKIASLGVVNTKIRFDDTFIPIEFEVIDSTENDIILGTKWMDDKGHIDFVRGVFTLYYQDKELSGPIIYKRLIIEQDPEDSDEEETLND
jgi:hypothetical protein